ncbi:MAG TPA: oxygen-dependent coproporphyrinogen oxidase [Rhabdochlamydiaceae bacterium]|jgi:coproporphyrinogen III oxidase
MKKSVINSKFKLKEEIVIFLKDLREKILFTFESLEPHARFQRSPWNYAKGLGGGEIGLMRGSVFEKAAVNFSEIRGDDFPTGETHGPFCATGISLITHMANPHAPTVHFNIRYIETSDRFWFGGGYDLTPMGFPYADDTLHFHAAAKEAIDPFGADIYPAWSQRAKEYFYIPHRKKERGVGGIFFDHYNTGDAEKDLTLWMRVGSTFLDAILPIYSKRIGMPYTSEQKERQLQLRAHYVEFNLLYDRGTQFGFLSGGNPEAILCSMPPLAKW